MTDELKAKAIEFLKHEWGVQPLPQSVRAVVRGMRWAAEECAKAIADSERSAGRIKEYGGDEGIIEAWISGQNDAEDTCRARFAANEQNKSEQAPLPAPADGATAETMGQHAGGVPRRSFQPESGNSPRDWVCSACHELYSESATSGAWRGKWGGPKFDEPLSLEHACLTRPIQQCGHMPALPISAEVADIIRALRKPAEGLAGSRGAEAPAVSPLDRAALIEKAHDWLLDYGMRLGESELYAPRYADFALSVMPKPIDPDAAELAEIARMNEPSAKPAPTFDEAIAFLEKQRDMPESMAKKWRERIRAHRDDDTEEFTVDLMEDFIEDLDRLSARAGKEAGK